MIEGTLYPSTNRGRYQVGLEEDARDLTSGQPLDVWINGKWIHGRVEHAGQIYATEAAMMKLMGGYYILFAEGGMCGLCAGMKVRIPE